MATLLESVGIFTDIFETFSHRSRATVAFQLSFLCLFAERVNSRSAESSPRVGLEISSGYRRGTLPGFGLVPL